MTKPQSVLAFDYGTQKIGIAFGQTLTLNAKPLTVIKAHFGKPDWNLIKELVSQWQPDHLAVGLPTHLDGTHTDSTRGALKFARRLSTQLSRPVAMIDERLSSEEAVMTLQNRHQGHETPSKKKRRGSQSIDAVAAAIIAQTWLSLYTTEPENIQIIQATNIKTPPATSHHRE